MRGSGSQLHCIGSKGGSLQTHDDVDLYLGQRAMENMPAENYDAICFFNSKDRDTVDQIVGSLKNRGLRIWFEQDELSPAAPVDTAIDNALKASRVAIVCVGRAGFGPFQEWERAGAVNQAIHRGMRLITVLLPGVDRDVIPNLPFTLTRNRAVQFKASPADTDALDDIEWGVTGKKPPKPNLLPDSTQKQARAAVIPPQPTSPAQRLASGVLRNGVTFFLGRRAALGAPGHPSYPSEITVRLARDLGLFRSDEEHLLPPPEAMGELFATEYGVADLERIFAAGGIPLQYPTIHDRLASLIGSLQERPKVRGMRKLDPQLIVTTSFDMLMECALLGRRLQFTRIVQNASQPRLYLTEIKQVPDQLNFSDPSVCESFISGQTQTELGIEFGGMDSSAIDNVSALNLEGRPEPILYKYHGSQDIPSSSAISTEQYHNLNRLQRLVPRRIREIAINTNSLFLGAGMLDYDFQHLYHTVLRDGFDQRRDLLRYAVLEKPSETSTCVYDEMALRVWDSLAQRILKRTGIIVVDQSPMTFTDALQDFTARS
jgi:hypothetical protein